MSELKNVAASVRQRLTNRAKETGRPFDELLQYYAMERFLYRLSKSKHHDKFVLKGALMFVVWEGPPSRSTRDIDLAGRTDNSIENLVGIVKDVCGTPVELDGMTFDAGSVKGGKIKEDAEYEGVRVRFSGRLDRARAAMQIDIGFGDAITPKPAVTGYPVILDMPAPKLKCYPRETAVAEKFQAMIHLGILNSRMKDFYDVWLLANRFDFDGSILTEAVKKTFAQRKTELSADPVVFTEAFWADAGKVAQWRAFLAKSAIAHAPRQLKDVVHVIKALLLPIVEACLKSQPLQMTWQAPGPWRK